MSSSAAPARLREHLTDTRLLFSYAIIGLAYPLFNSFLPLYLTQIPGETTDGAYRNYIIQAACGVPGSIIAAALVEWKVRGKWSFVAGRKGALAWCTILSGVFLVSCLSLTVCGFAFTADEVSLSSSSPLLRPQTRYWAGTARRPLLRTLCVNTRFLVFKLGLIKLLC
jgi:hypothetical protein